MNRSLGFGSGFGPDYFGMPSAAPPPPAAVGPAGDVIAVEGQTLAVDPNGQPVDPESGLPPAPTPAEAAADNRRRDKKKRRFMARMKRWSWRKMLLVALAVLVLGKMIK